MADPAAGIPGGFALLPYEIRQQIWLDAFAQPNLFALNHAQSPDNAHIKPSIIPIGPCTSYVGASCREARHLFQQTHVAIVLADHIRPRRIWFNAQTVLCVYSHRWLVQCFEPDVLRSLRIVADHWPGPIRRAHYTALAGLLGGYVCGDETVITSRHAGLVASGDARSAWRRERTVRLLFRQIMQPPLTALSVSAGQTGLAAIHTFAILDPAMFDNDKMCHTNESLDEKSWDRAAELPCAEGSVVGHAGVGHTRFSPLAVRGPSGTMYEAIMRWIRPQS